jgi:hypothetical protein
MRPPTIAILALVGMLPITEGCSRSTPGQGGQPGRTVQASLSEMTDEQKLMLFEYAPLGATLSQVKEIAPELGTPRAEGLPARGLSDAGAAIEVFGHQTRAEFNFRRDTLYSVNFGPLMLPADSGDALFDNLNKFYSGRFGTPLVDDGEDSPYFVKSRFWRTPRGEVGVHNSIDDGRRILGWGYQPALNTKGRGTGPVVDSFHGQEGPNDPR